MNPMNDKNCGKVFEHMDLYLDGELEMESRQEMDSHLRICDECGTERDRRLAMKMRLRAAVREIKAPEALEVRVRQSLQAAGPPGRHSVWRGPLAAIAAAVAVISGAGIAYELGYLRLTSASQQAYYNSLATHVNGLMRVALSDHIHCAFFRKYPKVPIPLSQMIQDMGPDYKPLIDVVKKNIPGDYQVEEAHRCTVENRKFVHVIAKSGSKIVSLVITRKENGETFAQQTSTAMLARLGQPVYEASAQRFELAAIETRDYLVYVVSNLDEQKNMELLTAFAPGVVEVLRGVEGS